jgi:hypothetical protein
VGDRFEQFIGAAEQGVAQLRTVAASIGGVGGNQMPLAVLANDPAAKILDANLQPAAARRTFLDEIGGIRHRGASSFAPAAPWAKNPIIALRAILSITTLAIWAAIRPNRSSASKMDYVDNSAV